MDFIELPDLDLQDWRVWAIGIIGLVFVVASIGFLFVPSVDAALYSGPSESFTGPSEVEFASAGAYQSGEIMYDGELFLSFTENKLSVSTVGLDGLYERYSERVNGSWVTYRNSSMTNGYAGVVPANSILLHSANTSTVMNAVVSEDRPVVRNSIEPKFELRTSGDGPVLRGLGEVSEDVRFKPTGEKEYAGHDVVVFTQVTSSSGLPTISLGGTNVVYIDVETEQIVYADVSVSGQTINFSLHPVESIENPSFAESISLPPSDSIQGVQLLNHYEDFSLRTHPSEITPSETVTVQVIGETGSWSGTISVSELGSIYMHQNGSIVTDEPDNPVNPQQETVIVSTGEQSFTVTPTMPISGELMDVAYSANQTTDGGTTIQLQSLTHLDATPLTTSPGSITGLDRVIDGSNLVYGFEYTEFSQGALSDVHTTTEVINQNTVSIDSRTDTRFAIVTQIADETIAHTEPVFDTETNPSHGQIKIENIREDSSITVEQDGQSVLQVNSSVLEIGDSFTITALPVGEYTVTIQPDSADATWTARTVTIEVTDKKTTVIQSSEE